MKISIRHINPSEHNDVSKLATENYSEEYFESDESFSSKIKNSYEGCFVADLDGVIGYVISFPYFIGKSFPINSIYSPVDNADCCYIHDLSISKDFRNKGVARMLVDQITNANWNVICLTAVQNSHKFWNKFGFRSFFDLDYCGNKAQYMILIKK